MLVRKLGVVAVSAALLLGTAGCSFTSNVATKKVYAPSDGNYADDGHIHARNVLVLSDGTNAYLIGSITNDGETAATATLSVEGGALAPATSFDVPAMGKVDFGYPAELGYTDSKPGIKLVGVLPPLGSNVEVTLDESAAPAANMAVQVLDGTIPTYAPLMPYLEPTASPTATPLASPTASPSPSN